ncbi:MAG TPA: MBL fold metallo-hydrolase [Clostridiales bacterium]|nr:MBL fold metallo-hydrolase [Clostridiales bacterium]
MKASVLSSGSGGNSTVIQSSGGSILIDAGLSAKRIVERLNAVGADISSIGALVITHDHIDHISGAGIIARKLKIPVYIHKENYMSSADKFDNCEVKFISDPFDAGCFRITPVPVSHDGTANYAYTVESEGKKISHITDIGVVTEIVRFRILNSDLIILESNHDLEMLKNGPYPWFLKQRISGNLGHLSNASAGDLIKETYSQNLKYLVLAHLSKENNDPSLAYDEMVKVKELNNFNFRLHVAKQDEVLEFIEI